MGWGLICGIAAIVVVPSLGVGQALAAPLSDRPGLQWLATVVATLGIYSLAVRGVEEVLEARSARAPGRPR